MWFLFSYLNLKIHAGQDTVFKLEARGMAAGALHGEMDKVARGNTLSAFRLVIIFL